MEDKTNQILYWDNKIFYQAVHIVLLRVHEIVSLNLFIERTYLNPNYSERILFEFDKSLTLLIISFSSILESVGRNVVGAARFFLCKFLVTTYYANE